MRGWSRMVFLAATIGAGITLAPLMALGQEEKGAGPATKVADAPPAAPPVTPSPPAEAPAPGVSPGGTPAPAEAEEEVAAPQSFLSFVFNASPFLFVLILLMSIYLGTVIVDGFVVLRLAKVIPPDVLTKTDALLNEKKYKEAYEFLKADPSLFAKSVAAGVERLAQGMDRAMESFVAAIEDGKLRYEHKISPVSTFGQLGPMIGLFGTVIGMILAFMTISSGEQVKTAKLAGEIAIALCATMEGLVLALPSIFFYAVLKNRLQRLIFDCEFLGERYLWKFAAGLKK